MFRLLFLLKKLPTFITNPAGTWYALVRYGVLKKIDFQPFGHSERYCDKRYIAVGISQLRFNMGERGQGSAVLASNIKQNLLMPTALVKHANVIFRYGLKKTARSVFQTGRAALY